MPILKKWLKDYGNQNNESWQAFEFKRDGGDNDKNTGCSIRH